MTLGSDLTQLGVQAALNQSEANTIKILPNHLTGGSLPEPDVLILDDYTVTELPKHGQSNVRRLLLSNRSEPYYVQCIMEMGFSGYLYLGDSLRERLSQAVKDLALGGKYLSPTPSAALASMQHYTNQLQVRLTDYQLEVLRLMHHHWSGGRIAAHLGRTTTAIYQVQRFLRDLFEVETNGELLDRAVELGILPDTRRISA